MDGQSGYLLVARKRNPLRPEYPGAIYRTKIIGNLWDLEANLEKYKARAAAEVDVIEIHEAQILLFAGGTRATESRTMMHWVRDEDGAWRDRLAATITECHQ